MEFGSWIVTILYMVVSAFPGGGGWAADHLIAAPHYHLTGVPAGISDFNPYISEDGESRGPAGYDISDGWYDVTPPPAADLGYAVYKQEDSCISFLRFEGEFYELGQWFGGYGVTSFALSDVNGDGAQELYFTCSWGSGLHRSHVAYFDPAAREMRALDFTHLDGDLVLSTGDSSELKLYTARVMDPSSFVDMLLVAEYELGTIGLEDGEIRLAPAG